VQRASTTGINAGVIRLDPPGVSEVDASGQPDRLNRALSQSVAPPGQATVVVVTVGRLLGLTVRAGCKPTNAPSTAAARPRSSSEPASCRSVQFAWEQPRVASQPDECFPHSDASVADDPHGDDGLALRHPRPTCASTRKGLA